jgi:hypothetical protein
MSPDDFLARQETMINRVLDKLAALYPQPEPAPSELELRLLRVQSAIHLTQIALVGLAACPENAAVQAEKEVQQNDLLQHLETHREIVAEMEAKKK